MARFNNIRFRVVGGSKGSAVRLALTNLASNHNPVFVDVIKEKENSWIVEIVYECVGDEDEELDQLTIGEKLDE